jgi:hypothetical protein
VEWIGRSRNGPFFVYLPQAMPGSRASPRAREAFGGKPAKGAYGDSAEEIDWPTGRSPDALESEGLDLETLVVWTPAGC